MNRRSRKIWYVIAHANVWCTFWTDISWVQSANKETRLEMVGEKRSRRTIWSGDASRIPISLIFLSSPSPCHPRWHLERNRERNLANYFKFGSSRETTRRNRSTTKTRSFRNSYRSNGFRSRSSLAMVSGKIVNFSNRKRGRYRRERWDKREE